MAFFVFAKVGKGGAKASFRVTLKYFEIKKAFRYYIKQIDSMLPLRLFSISINLLAFYHECRSLIGYATHVLFCDR